jgi:tetratricopeptide (TPR) repeat protein
MFLQSLLIHKHQSQYPIYDQAVIIVRFLAVRFRSFGRQINPFHGFRNPFHRFRNPASGFKNPFHGLRNPVLLTGLLLLLFHGGPAYAAGGFYFPNSERLSLPDSLGSETKLTLFIDEQDRLYILNFSADQMLIYGGSGFVPRQVTGWNEPEYSRGDRPRQLLTKWRLHLPAELLTKTVSFWVNGDRIYVKPAGDHFIWIYNIRGDLLERLPLKVPANSFMVYTDIAVDQRGYVYLLESGALRVDVFDTEGNNCGIFTSSGHRDNQLPGLLESIFIDNQGSLYCLVKIPGIDKSQIVKYSYQGRKLATFPQYPEHLYANIYVDQYQNLFAVAPAESLVDKFDLRGRKICWFQTPCQSGLAVDHAGQVYLDSGKNGAITRMYPTTVIQWIDAGNAALLDESWEVAERHFKRAQVLDNQLDYIHSILGEVYFRQHRWNEAMDEFKYLKDNWRYSQTLTQFRNTLLLNYWPLIIVILLMAGFGIIKLFSYARARQAKPSSAWRHLSFISVIWRPSAALQTKSRSMSPVTAVLIIIIFVIIHYLSRIGTNPIFTGERQILSWVIFGRSLFLIGALIFIWSLTAYKVGELFYGLASYTHILNSTAICLVPMIAGEPVLALLSHLLTFDEFWIYQWLYYLLFSWTVILVFNKIRLTEDFSWSKALGVGLINLASTALFIVFLSFMMGVNQQLISFLTDVYKEIYNRFTV